MDFEKSIFYIRVVNEEVVGDLLTEYQMSHIVGAFDNDYYDEGDAEYYRVYYQKNPGLYNMVYNYNTPNIEKGVKVTYQYTEEVMSDEMLSNVFERKWDQVRAERNRLLMESDQESMISLPDVWQAKSEDYKTAWLQYREELRSLPQRFTNPFEVVWPTKPEL